MPLTFVEQDLQPYNTLGLTARAPVSVLSDESELAEVCREVAACPASQAPFILGGGSNVVMEPCPQHRVLRVALRGVGLWRETATHWIVEAAAGESWHGFVSYCLAQGWAGLENLALIPGTVGAAPVQNIGAYGVELAERLHSVVAWDLRAGCACELSASDCGFAYRDSLFKQAGPGGWLITRVRVALPKRWSPRLGYPDLRRHPLLQVGDPAQAQAVVSSAHEDDCKKDLTPQRVFDAVCDIRRHKLPDPVVLGNAGSFFKNPMVPAAQAQRLQVRFPGLRMYPQPDGFVKLAAGWLIEQAGWKGRCLGPVGMHDRQSLVLVNHGGATADDVHALASAVQADVRQRFGVALEQEPVSLN